MNIHELLIKCYLSKKFVAAAAAAAAAKQMTKTQRMRAPGRAR